MKKKEEIEEITLKNTKAEILAALNEALEREKSINKSKSNPEEEAKRVTINKAIKSSEENIDKNIFSEELIKKFKDLELAISAEEEKLKELYGIEKELNHLTIVMNAGKDCIAEIEVQKKEQQEKLETSIINLESEYKEKFELLKKEYDDKQKSLKLERDREIEEYNYKTKREREISNNKWEDEKRTRESILKNKEIETENILKSVESRANEIKELEKEVENIPNMLEKEYNRGKEDITKELEKEHKYTIEILKKDYQNTIDRQEDRINSLKEEIDRVNKLNLDLQVKTDKAYLQLKELATKTVEATGGVKIIGNSKQDNN